MARSGRVRVVSESRISTSVASPCGTTIVSGRGSTRAKVNRSTAFQGARNRAQALAAASGTASAAAIARQAGTAAASSQARCRGRGTAALKSTLPARSAT